MKSKVVLVTGGATRLGAEICWAFLESGHKVFCHYNKSSRKAFDFEKSATPGTLELVQADLSQQDGFKDLISAVYAKAGKLDVLINNASMFEPDTGTSVSTDSLTKTLTVNLMAPVLLSREAAALPRDESGETGCIVHILDQKVFNLNPDYFSYTISKLALERAVSLQAQALAPWWRVCGVAPGLMYNSGPQTDENFALASKANLLNKPTDPQDVANTCVFLANNKAISGVTLCVDNGQHLVPLPRDIMFVVDDLLKWNQRDQHR